MKRCGFAAVLGETNAGKSTLINQLVGQKVAAVSRKAQTTQSRILGIAIHGESQIILIDTPGFLRNRKVENLERTIWEAFREAEEVLFLVDVTKKSFRNSMALLKKIDDAKKVSLILNKIDLIHKPKLLELAGMFNEVRDFRNIFMTSGKTGDGLDKILEHLALAMPEGEWIYNHDEITDSSFEKYTSEITREHIYHRLHQEVPYECLVECESFQDQPDGSIKIVQHIHVKNQAHRMIFLGRDGGKIKAIGKAVREELSSLLGRPVHLFLHVLVDRRNHPQKGD